LVAEAGSELVSAGAALKRDGLLKEVIKQGDQNGQVFGSKPGVNGKVNLI
jgi:hypothetical protein